MCDIHDTSSQHMHVDQNEPFDEQLPTVSFLIPGHTRIIAADQAEKKQSYYWAKRNCV